MRLISPATEKIAWDFAPNESFLDGQLRALLIGAAGGGGHEKTTEMAKRKFKAYIQGDSKAINPSLRLAVFRTVIGEGGEPEYNAVRAEYANAKSIDGKETCLLALGRVQTPSLVNDFLDFQFSDQVAVQDTHTGSVSLAANPKARGLLWAYVKEHWDTVSKKLSVNPVVMDRYMKTGLSKFSSHDVEKDIASFFKGKDTKGYDRGLVQVSDTVRASANYKERDEQLILEWLKAHDYV